MKTQLNRDELLILRELVNKQWMSKELQALDVKLALMRDEAKHQIEASSAEPAAPAETVFGEIEEELRRLRWWKQEALEVMGGMQDLGRELGLRPGLKITGSEAARKARHMRKALEKIADPSGLHSERARQLAEEALR